MATPRIPGSDPDAVALPCDGEVQLTELDLGMREYACGCGETHAIVMDVHPPTRFFPEAVVDVLRETIDPADADELGTRHLMGLVIEEYPDSVVATDVSENGYLGCHQVWITDFDSRRLHEVLVELVVEVMDHAMSHTEDADAQSAFAERLAAFDVSSFVEQYREERSLERQT